MSASVDELSCRFVGKNGKKYEIHANITVSSFQSLSFTFSPLLLIVFGNYLQIPQNFLNDKRCLFIYKIRIYLFTHKS